MSQAIPETSFLQISAAAAWIELGERDRFLHAIADDLAGHEIGEGVVARAVAKAFRAAFNPPLGPKQLRKLSMGHEAA